MAKRRTSTARLPREDLSQPSRWRLQHGAVGDPVRVADPETRAPVSVRRVVDTLAAMEANGTITKQMHDAGVAFRSLFRTAALDPLRAAPTLRLPRSTGETMTERQLDARARVAAALDALGGADSAAGSCVWHVIGCECSLREWASRQGWSGRVVGHSQAGGILVAALGVLAAHYARRHR